MFNSTRRALGALILASAIFLQACAFNFASAARTVGRSAGQAIPVVQSLVDSGECSKCVDIVGTLHRVQEDSNALATAFDSGDNTTALQKAASITRALDQLIAVDSKIIPANKRTLVLALLAAADIAIAEIANHTQSEAPKAIQVAAVNRSADVQVMVAYAKKPRLRARSSQTGKFVTLEYAKAHPDVTQIERF